MELGDPAEEEVADLNQRKGGSLGATWMQSWLPRISAQSPGDKAGLAHDAVIVLGAQDTFAIAEQRDLSLETRTH